MCVGQKIKMYLKEQGVSEKWISTTTGIKLSKLNQSLNGNRRLTFTEYEIICFVLKVRMDQFIRPRKS